MHEVRGALHHQGEQHVLRFERKLVHPPEKIWRALTDNDELVHWFPVAIGGERAAGAELQFAFHEQGGPPVDEEMATMIAASQRLVRDDEEAMSGEMRAYDPPRVLEYAWKEELLRFELHPGEEQGVLIFLHTFAEAAQAVPLAAGWHVALDALQGHLDGVPAAPATMATFSALMGDYADEFTVRASAAPPPTS